MVAEISIFEGMEAFKKEFDFRGKVHTQKTYLRALDLFSYFITSPKDAGASQYRNLGMESPLSELPESILAGYLAFIREHPYPADYRGRGKIVIGSEIDQTHPQKPYSQATLQLYETALKRVLRFWRAKKWITFTELDQVEAKLSTSTQQKNSRKSLITRAEMVPSDLGPTLLSTADKALKNLGSSTKSTRLARLDTLRAKCMVHIFMATGLRASDLVALTIESVMKSTEQAGRLYVKTIKSGTVANCYLGPEVIKSIEAYLKERNDDSPWLFIQHARGGRARKVKSKGKNKGVKVSYSKLKMDGKTRKGYGCPITTATVWRIIQKVAKNAQYDTDNPDLFLSPHALRHWLGQTLRTKEVPLDLIQANFGHSSVDTTQKIYAPKPNMAAAIEALKEIQLIDQKREESPADEQESGTPGEKSP